MSGAQTSTFPTMNDLLAPMAAYDTHANALLLQQQHQQEISDHDIAMTGQAAAPLLGMSEEDAAKAYPGWLQDMQSRGLAKYAPATYPGHAATQALVQRAMPLMDQFKAGYITTPEQKAFIDRVWPGSTPPTATASSSTAPATAAPVPPYGGGTGNLPVPQEYMPYFQEASQRTGIPIDLLIAQSRQESGFNPGATGRAGEVGLMQIHPKTAASPGFGMQGVQNPDVLRDPRTNINFGADYLKARAGGADLTTPQGQAAALRAYNGGGDPNYVANVFRYMPPSGGGSGTSAPGTVAVGDSLGVGVGQAGRMRTFATEGAQPSAIAARINSDEFPALNGQDVVLSTGASNNPKDFASIEQQIRNLQGKGAGRITVLGVGDRPNLAGVNDKLAALAKAYGADFRPIDPATLSGDRVHPANYAALVPPTAVRGGAGAPSGAPTADGRYQVASTAQTPPPASTAPASGQPQPQAQVVPQPPPNRAMPGSPDGPPAMSPPTSAPAQPNASSGVGVNSPQYQQAQQYLRQAAAARMMPGYAVSPQLQATAAWLQQQGESMMKLETFRDLGGGMQQNVLTGETKYNGPPTARSTTDNAGNTWILNPGQPPQLLHANVSGVTGTGPEASAQRTVQEIGPKVANGTATPQEQANYATAVEVYRGASIEHDPNTNGLVRVYKRDLPPGFPPSPFTADGGGTAQPLTKGMTPSQKSAEEELGKGFATTDKKSYDASSASLGMLTAMNNDAEILNRTPGGWAATGTGANTKLELGKALNTVSGFFGGKPFVDPAQISAWESLNKQTKLMGMQVVNSYFGGSREAASIINGATGAVPGSENSYLGFRLVSSGIEQDLLRQRELYEFKAQRLQDGKPLITAEADFNKAHPVETYTARAIANAVPDDMVSRLMATPDAETIKAFDKHFGPGIGEFIVRGGRSGMGRAGVPSNG